MLREKPPYNDGMIAACLEQQYGISVAGITFLPIGYDPYTAVYRVDARDGTPYFLKLTRNTIVPASLNIPRTLLDHGIANVLAPLRTVAKAVCCPCGDAHAIVYPFIHGENAMVRGMSAEQWRAFGATLRAVHESGLATEFAGSIPVEDFAAPAINRVRTMQKQIQATPFDLAVQQQLATFWQENAALIRYLTDRAERLGSLLQTRNLPNVLCHGDVHAANVMLGDDGGLYLVDWDTPRIAPRERDLLFVVGSIIARRVEPHEEALFFQGYGATNVDQQALTYYRYERALEDLYECSRSVFNSTTSLAVKQADARMAIGLFQPGDIVALAMSGDKQGT